MSDESPVLSSTDHEDAGSESESSSVRKKRRFRRPYRRSIHFGISAKQARYYNVTTEVPTLETHGGQTTSFMQSQHWSSAETSLSSSFSDSTTTDSDLSNTDSDKEEDPCSSQSTPDEKMKYKNMPLFEGSQHSVFSAFAIVMLYVMKHSLSRQAFADLLLLINSLLPKSEFTTSVYKIKEVLKKCIFLQDPYIHTYCENCQSLLENGNPCEKEVCRRNDAKVVKFLDLRLEEQLKEFFQDERFCRMVSRSNRPRPADSGGLIDITDGSQYKAILQSQGRPVADVHFTFTMNTDGVAVFSSSKKGNLWPVYLAINELPIKLRFSRKYIIPCLLHCEVEKPNMLTYLLPLMTTLKKLYSEGIEVKTPNGKWKVTGQLLTATLDLPARALVSNMKQFNGKSSCVMCFDEGECPAGQTLHRYFPYKVNSIDRTHPSLLNDALEASRKGDAVNGVKGASPLVMLKYIDLPQFFVIDWMHCVLLGVVKNLMSFWLDAKYRTHDFFIGHNLVLLNNRLLRIKIPDFITRRQRSLADHSRWKASECREWLIHFSLPVLYGQLNPEAFVHYTLLVTAMALLTKEGVQACEIDYAEKLITDFCRIYPAIYGATKQTMNVHLLKHMAQFTRLYGPLYSHSAFGFESMNSHVKNMVHGTGHVNSQISFAVGMTKSLGQLVRELIETLQSESIRKTVLSLGTKFIVEENLNMETAMLGKKKQLSETDESFSLVPEDKRQTAVTFQRLQTPEGVYFCKKYQQNKTKNSYTVEFVHKGQRHFGFITSFVKIEDEHYVAIVPYRTTSFFTNEVIFTSLENEALRNYSRRPLCPHIFKIIEECPKVLVHDSAIRKKCVFMDLKCQIQYISSPPNRLEHG